LANELFRPATVDGPGASSSTGQRRSAGPRLGAGFPGAARGAPGRSTTPHLSSSPCRGWEGRYAVGAAGPCCGEWWVAGYPCARSSAARTARLCAARRRRLRV
jgi:hypothetical protein